VQQSKEKEEKIMQICCLCICGGPGNISTPLLALNNL